MAFDAGRRSIGAGLAVALLLTACGNEERRAPPQPAPPIQFEAVAVAGDTPRAALLRHGRRLAKVLGCEGCHGADLRGRLWSEEADFAIQYSSNLTRIAHSQSPAEIERGIRLGVRPDGSPLWEMPSAIFTHLSEPDMRAILAYLRSLPAAGPDHLRIVMGPQARREIAAGQFRPAADQVREGRNIFPAPLDGRHEEARYMVRATCGECHALDLSGGGPPGGAVRPDLVVAGTYTREQFRHLMRTGEATGGRRLGLMAQVARGRFIHLTDRETDAIHDYLVARANAPR